MTFNEEGAADWYEGIVCDNEMPPPPAPAPSELSFQTTWVAGGPSAVSVVPPTPVTYGWLAGSSTASESSSQSSEPESPAAAKTDCPLVAASSKRVFSAAIVEEPASDSHRPHDVEMTFAVSAEMMDL